MSYQITFKGMNAPPAVIVSTERGEKLKAIWMSAEASHKLEIDGDLFLAGDIKRITQVADPKPQPVAALPAGPKCKGQYSIQLEIMRVAKEVSGRKHTDNPDGLKWPKLLQSKRWKEQMRKKLRSHKDVLWCDHIANECACDPDKEGQGIEAVHKIFGSVGKGAMS